MKRVFIIIIAVLALAMPDANGQRKGDRAKSDTLMAVDDSLQYELIVLDPQFETWLISRPIGLHSNEYYQHRNILYVQEWNSRYMNSLRYGDLYTVYIDYSPFIEYDIELNYKLYNYFLFFEEKNRVKLLPTGR